MEIASNAVLEDGKLTLLGLKDRKLEEILRNQNIDAYLDARGLAIPVDSRDEAVETYIKVVKAILHTPHLEKLGFSFREILGYSFLIYLKEYRDGMENEILNHPLKQEFDIVTLPNSDGYYYSTLYGLDNLSIPALLSLGNLFAEELVEIVENNPSLMELLELKRISKNVLRLERFGESRLAKYARNLEKVERIEEIIKKMLAIRYAFSCELAIAGNIEYAEIQKIRRLGNGLCVYLSRTLRDELDLREGDAVSVRVLAGKIFIEKV